MEASCTLFVKTHSDKQQIDAKEILYQKEKESFVSYAFILIKRKYVFQFSGKTKLDKRKKKTKS